MADRGACTFVAPCEICSLFFPFETDHTHTPSRSKAIISFSAQICPFCRHCPLLCSCWRPRYRQPKLYWRPGSKTHLPLPSAANWCNYYAVYQLHEYAADEGILSIPCIEGLYMCPAARGNLGREFEARPKYDGKPYTHLWISFRTFFHASITISSFCNFSFICYSA